MRSPIRCAARTAPLRDPSRSTAEEPSASFVIPAKAGIEPAAGNSISMVFARVTIVKDWSGL